LWSPAGTVLYSDEPRLVGDTFALEDEGRDALTSSRIEADISDGRRPENRFETGRLLEVYRPVWTPDGHPLLFETYFRYDSVAARSHELFRGFGGVMLSSLAALLLLLAPLIWALLVRERRGRAQRELLMRRALAASEDERRRIAASLHDGVVQQLAATSFGAAGLAEQAAADGRVDLADGLSDVTTSVRDSIAGLRSLLVDIYPPSLATSGLAAAVRDLARTTGASTAAVRVDVVAAADALPDATQQAVFRVAQEALRNAVSHSEAHHVDLDLTGDRLDVVDDGLGFDAASGDRDGHFGLRLMQDAARSCGAGLLIATAPGRGTRIRMELP
jgi:two-component system NarL family sensor kinase